MPLPTPMSSADRVRAVAKARAFFVEEIYRPKLAAISKFGKLSEYKVNPFTELFLSNLVCGNDNPESIAETLLVPKIASSLAGTTGTKMQKFCSQVLATPGSMIAGMDIEFFDFLDRKQKFCQVKLGPATINDKDVNPIVEEFKKARRLARTNNRSVAPEDLVLGILYGSSDQLNSPYKRLQKEFPIFVGADFFMRVTGNADFYPEFVAAVRSAAAEFRNTTIFRETLTNLTSEVRRSRAVPTRTA